MTNIQLGRHTLNSRLLKYGIVGLFAAVVEYGSFYIALSTLPQSALWLSVAQTISFLLAVAVNFSGSRLLTFRDRIGQYAKSRLNQFISYFILALVNLVLSNIILLTATNSLGMQPLVAKLITMLVITVWTFGIFNKLIFKTR